MISRFPLRMAARELRASGRRLALFLASVSVGVAAIVAVEGFKANAIDSLEAQGRRLLGADLELQSRFPFSAEVEAALDSVARTGSAVARARSLPTMVASASTGRTALLAVRAIDPAFPFYGSIETEPAGSWPALEQEGIALAEPAALVRLNLALGDTVLVGGVELALSALVRAVPGDPGIRSAVNPRLYVTHADLDRTGLIQPGSLVGYRAYLSFPEEEDLRTFLRRHAGTLRRASVTWDTARERERDLARALDALGRFLGLAGLGALLLGGIGVASAMHVYVREHRRSAAVLRCLGARGGEVVRIYVLQALLLGLGGSLAGAAAGVGLQALLPGLLADFLPPDFAYAFAPGALAAGILAGVWTAGLFAWRAILSVRRTRALGALREAAIGEADGDAHREDRWPRRLTDLALAGTLLGLAAWQAGGWGRGLAFAAAVAVTLFLLRGAAGLLMRVLERLPAARASFPVRQGVANLFRPRNQTRAAIVAVGLAVFVVGTIRVVERNVRDGLSLEGVGFPGNVAVLDVQPDRTRALRALVAEGDGRVVGVLPILPARLHAVRGRTAAAWLEESGPGRSGVRDSAASDAPRRWALQREYRLSARDSLAAGERILAGEWWSSDGEPDAVRLSLEEGVAEALGVSPGDTVVWDLQGRLVESVLASVREVDWSRLEPNFLALFAPGSLGGLPRTDLVLARIEEEGGRARFQDRAVREHPGVIVIDLTSLQETVSGILDRASLVIRFMGGFTVVAGLLVLAAVVMASRDVRRRENALLRSMGAESSVLRRILLTEFLLLGGLAATVGVGMATTAGWALVRYVFELPFSVPAGDLALLWTAATLLTLGLGVLGSRAVLRPHAMSAIRRAEAVG